MPTANLVFGHRYRCLGSLLVLLAASPSSFAALTIVRDSPDPNNEPNLIGSNPYPDNPNPSILETLYGEHNLRRIDDSRDHRFRIVGEAAYLREVASFGGIFSAQIVGERPTRPRKISSIAIRDYTPQPSYGYTIAKTLYGDYFEIQLADNSASSDPSRNPEGNDLLVTFEIVGNVGHPDNPIGSLVLGLDYITRSGVDFDYQDVVWEVSGATPVGIPEPSSVALLVTATLLGVALFRRCR